MLIEEQILVKMHKHNKVAEESMPERKEEQEGAVREEELMLSMVHKA